jgi:hypothetical protein
MQVLHTHREKHLASTLSFNYLENCINVKENVHFISIYNFLSRDFLLLRKTERSYARYFMYNFT